MILKDTDGVMHLRESKLREIELRVQREIHEKRQELLAKEESLRYDCTAFQWVITSAANI